MSQNNNQSEALNSLVKELGIDNLPENKQSELLIKMTEVLLKRIFIETMDNLGEQGRVEYEELMKKKASPEQLESFFKEKISNYDEIVEKIISEFKQEMTAVNQE